MEKSTASFRTGILVCLILFCLALGHTLTEAQGYVIMQSGKLVSISADEIKITLSDGKTMTYQMTTETKITDDNGKTILLDAFKAGEKVTVAVHLNDKKVLELKKGSTVAGPFF